MARKIQHKRGLRQDLPQLDSAEIGFTTDTKEIYIGSGDGNQKVAMYEDVESAVEDVHTHENKEVLDKLTDDDGKLKYDGQEVGAVTSVNGQTGDVGGLATEEYVDSAISDIPDVTKESIGLSNVENIKQASKAEFDTHVDEFLPHGANNAGFHNSIYRGKNLGGSVTSEQYDNISNGSFKDMYIGDYWEINGVNWRIAAFNYFYNSGSTSLTSNHITIVPDKNLYNHRMNDTNTTDGGYLNSLMREEGLDQAKDTIEGIFGSHLIERREYLSNATDDGKASASAWDDSTVEIMSEIMVYGQQTWGESTAGVVGYNRGTGKTQLPLFALRSDLINTRQNYWLRDVYSATYFAYVVNGGYAFFSGASTAAGVRPAFSIS